MKGSNMSVRLLNHQKCKECILEKLLIINASQNISETEPHLPADSRKPVNFYCAAPSAVTVELVGDFNHWHPFPMEKSLDGWWLTKVFLPHGHHLYRFLIDGKAMLDSQAGKIAPDEHGE